MAEADKPAFTLSNEAMNQYAAIGNELRFYADQRFKIVGAFLIANGLLANVGKDHRSVYLAAIGIALSYLCLSWDKKTTLWWGLLIEVLKKIENQGCDTGKLVAAYRLYQELPTSRVFVKPSHAVTGIYVLIASAWIIFGIYSWPCCGGPI